MQIVTRKSKELISHFLKKDCLEVKLSGSLRVRRYFPVQGSCISASEQQQNVSQDFRIQKLEFEVIHSGS